MRFRDIKVGQIVITTTKCAANPVADMESVAEVIEKRTEGDFNVIDIRDSDGVIYTVAPKDIASIADSTVEANFREGVAVITADKSTKSTEEIWVGDDGSELKIVEWKKNKTCAEVIIFKAGPAFVVGHHNNFSVIDGVTKFTKKTDAVIEAPADQAEADAAPTFEKPNIVRVIRYVRPMQKTNDKVCPRGDKGITLVIDINHNEETLTIYHAECNGETFCKQRGIEEALKKNPEVFPYNRNHTLVGHVAYIVTKAKRRSMKHLAQLREQMLEAMATRRLS